jgi:hypothetical protein
MGHSKDFDKWKDKITVVVKGSVFGSPNFTAPLHRRYCRLCFRLRAALLYVGFHCHSLHVSAYMAIFKCVGFFIYLFSYP